VIVTTSDTNAGSANFPGFDNYLKTFIDTNTIPFNQFSSTFTIEAWIYMTQNPSETVIGSTLPGLFGDGDSSNAGTYFRFGPMTNRILTFWWNDGIIFNNCNGSTAMTLNSWHHVALSVNNNAMSMYVDGQQETLSGVTTLTNRVGILPYFYIGEFYIPSLTSAYVYGNVSNFRLVNGVSVYTGNFTVPSSPLTPTQTASTNISAITNTTDTCYLLNFTTSSFLTDSSFYNLTTNIIGGNVTSSLLNPF
jgi:hypothetical protein